MFVIKHGVGLDSRVEHVVQLLLGEPNDGVRMIGIYGMGGIGKTTLARAVYNRLFGYFESSCFLEIESAISEQQNNGINLEKVNNQIKKLQKKLFRELFNEEIEVGSVGEGIMLMQKRLQAKKCLILLDNLEHINQFNALCGERDWFGRGSRLILTTRDTNMLKNLKEDEHYEVEVLNLEESLQLFSLHAFGEPTLPKEYYAEVLDGIVTYCGGLPLALEVLGAYLYDKSREEWISAFEKLKGIPHNDVQAKLKISYDGLPDDRTKSLFLDLVCFSKGIPKETIDNMGYFSTIEIRNLVDKCLINCRELWISMHSLIQDMGREIIRLESPNNPSERSRLWCPYDIHDVLIGQKGTNKIEMIVLNSPMKNMKYSTKAFKNMKNLRFLQIDKVHLYGNFKHLSKVLRCLRWNRCPQKSIPFSHSFEKLVSLEMQESNIKEFRTPLKYFPYLESLDLASSKCLTRTPNFSGAQNLRSLSFRGCSSLVKVHSSIGELGRLDYLDFGWCEKLKKLPNNLCYLSSLQKLKLLNTNINGLPSNLSHLFKLESIYLSLCKNLEVLPELSHNVEYVFLDHCKNLKMIQELPLNLREINLYGCKNLEMLPELPPNLWKISLPGCKNLKKLPKLPPSLREINLDGCINIKMLPELPPDLWKISLDGCKNLKMLPEFPPNLWTISLDGNKNLKMLPKLPQKLEFLSAKNCESMEKVPNLSNCMGLQVLDLTGCRKLKKIQGWENLHLRVMKLGGVPHINFSESIKEVLIIGSELNSGLDFKCTLAHNEIPSWIKCQEEGSSISFQWPSHNLENYTLGFLGFFFWVVFKAPALPRLYHDYYITIENNGFKADSWIYQIQLLEAEEISFLHIIKRGDLNSYLGFQDIKAGEVIKVTSKDIKAGEVIKVTSKDIKPGEVIIVTSKDKFVKSCMVKKIGAGALYRDKDGFVQFVPITKVG